MASKLHQIASLPGYPIVVTSHAILGDEGKDLAADRSRYIKKTSNLENSFSARHGHLHPAPPYSEISP